MKLSYRFCWVCAGIFVLAVGAVAAWIQLGKSAALSDVTFDSDYRSSYVRYLQKDYPERKQVRVYYVNRTGIAAGSSGGGYASGAKLLLEVFNAELDDQGQPKRDAGGRLIRGDLSVISMMQKGAGFGSRYEPELRNGDWSYAFFRPDGVEVTTLPAAVDCLNCHKARAADQDFVISSKDLHALFPRQ